MGGATELKQLYVLSEYYGTGIGKALYGDAVKKTQQANHRWIWLVVSDENMRAQAFYRKQAFKRVAAGPVLNVGSESLTSSILAKEV